MKRHSLLPRFLFVGILLVSACVTVAPEKSEPESVVPPGARIHLWTRGSGQYEHNRVNPRLNEKVFELANNKLKNSSGYDLQYGRRLEFKGLKLNDILSTYQPAAASDMILLHFRNEVTIPVPLLDDDENTISKQVFLAFKIRDEDGKWSQDFPDIERVNDRNQVTRRIQFDVNKIVVSTPEHSFLESEGSKRSRRFSPWRYANDLVGIEFVDQKAWEGQFAAGTGQVAEGQEVFLNRCQYCHSVRSVGSKRGWDFDGPIKAYVKRDAESLLYHVKYPKAFAEQYGRSMPTQPSFTEQEAESIWTWMRAISKKSKLQPYTP